MRFILPLILLSCGNLYANTSLEVSALLDHRDNAGYNHLKGPVKSVRFFYTHWREGLTPAQQQSFYFLNDIRASSFYQEFDTNGILKGHMIIMQDSIDQPIVDGELELTMYGLKDYQLKKKYAQDLRIPAYPAFNYCQTINPNMTTVTKEAGIGAKRDTTKLVYRYDFYSNGKIRTELKFKINERNGGSVTQPTLRDLEDSTVFIYNEKGQLSEQRVFPGQGHTMNYINYETLVPGKAHTFLYYTYDDRGRIMEVSSYVNKLLTLKESYTYHKTEGYLQTKIYQKIFLGSGTVQYDSNGQVLRSIPYSIFGKVVPFVSRHYEYEYDSYGNWIRCNMYLEGNLTEPTAIAQRLISYF